MPFPTRLLHHDEEVLLDQRPHVLRLASPAALGLLVVAAVVTGFVWWESAPTWFGILLGAALVVDCGYFGTRYTRWASTNLVITSHRIVYRAGVVRRSGREIPIEAVQSVSFQQSLLGRLAGIGTLTVESAGEQGEQAVPDVRDPEAAQSVVHRAIESAAARRSGAISPGTRDLADQLERLAALNARGVITDAELERAKRDLLGSS